MKKYSVCFLCLGFIALGACAHQATPQLANSTDVGLRSPATVDSSPAKEDGIQCPPLPDEPGGGKDYSDLIPYVSKQANCDSAIEVTIKCGTGNIYAVGLVYDAAVKVCERDMSKYPKIVKAYRQATALCEVRGGGRVSESTSIECYFKAAHFFGHWVVGAVWRDEDNQENRRH